MTEKEIAFNLIKSKIFLSFSELEGFGRPPLEAAIAGNKVIGYHGEGWKEYMKKPVKSYWHNKKIMLMLKLCT